MTRGRVEQFPLKPRLQALSARFRLTSAAPIQDNDLLDRCGVVCTVYISRVVRCAVFALPP